MTARPTDGERAASSGEIETLERRLARAVARARAALFWEWLWPALAAPLGVVMAFLLVSWAGLWLVVPPWGRLTGLGLFALALLASLVPIARLRWPSAEDGIRRLETAGGLKHRPISALADTLSGGGTDAGTQTLWIAHCRRAAAGLGRLTAGTPSPRLDRHDPYALRAALALTLVVAFIFAGPDRMRRVLTAFDTGTAGAAQEARFDAWVTPPAYTGRAPVFLTRAEMLGQRVRVPQGSEFVARMDGGRDFSLEEVEIGEDPSAPPLDIAERSDGASIAEFKHRLNRSVVLRVTSEGRETAAWTFDVTPDEAPRIAFAREPEQALSGALSLAYTVEDDYGVVEAEARFEPAEAEGDEDAAPLAAEPRPLYEAPDFRLSLPQRRTRAGTAETYRDLTEHPWAGGPVELTLAARDEADQWGFSETRTLALPERAFNDPLARAVIEQRRILALDANAGDRVMSALEALTADPERRIESVGVYLGLRTAFWRLRGARDDDVLRSVVDQLWEVALAIEDGDLALAARELREAQEALRRALEEGASDEELEQLMQDLRQAMSEYLQQMLAEAQRNPQQDAAQPADGQNLRVQDLDRMLNEIEELARSGASDAAREMLAQLQNMLENMQAQQQGGSSEMQEALDELGEMIREQQQLMNETFRAGQQNGQQQDLPAMPQMPGFPQMPGMPPFMQDMPSPSQEGSGQSPGDMSPEELAEALGQIQEGQQALRERLEEMLQAMQQNGMQGEELGDAGQAMGEAERALGSGESGAAVDSQGQALDGLRRGAQSLADQMAGEGEGEGEGAGGSRPGMADEDPLGRPRRTEGSDFGTSVHVPDEIERQRARQILEELRRRLSDPARPRIELDYLERLLDRF